MAIESHEWVMLRKNSTSRSSGTPSTNTVALLAPNFEVTPQGKNNLFGAPRPRDQSSIVRDQRVITHEVIVQGAFIDSASVDSNHRDALEAIFGGPATARDQVNRIWRFFQITGGAFELYDGNDEYTAVNDAAVDYASGKFPQVHIDEFRPQFRSGRTKRIWVIKFQVGVERSS